MNKAFVFGRQTLDGVIWGVKEPNKDFDESTFFSRIDDADEYANRLNGHLQETPEEPRLAL